MRKLDMDEIDYKVLGEALTNYYKDSKSSIIESNVVIDVVNVNQFYEVAKYIITLEKHYRTK